ncbi:anaerobic ribonucleoside-triphosphate reductase activating protein [Candidatus Peregrinibacteria bacterium]|nr:MAG: anaerobic ribonucleoside-triphosphate reductase activating protein [Candidatus Peregrinibacteria bacterium]
MLISAVNKMTLLDYPGKTAAIIFTAGCNFRCGYCHNAQFVLPEKIKDIKNDFIEFSAVKNFLSQRIGLIDGVTFCGGEPTIHQDLEQCMKEVKDMGFLVKLDTNGTRPEIINSLIEKGIVDFIAMDIKYFEKNTKLLGDFYPEKKIKESIALIQHAKNIDYEFRSTILPKYHTPEVLDKMGQMIQGAKTWSLQNFRAIETLNTEFQKYQSFHEDDLEKLRIQLSKYADTILIRT